MLLPEAHCLDYLSSNSVGFESVTVPQHLTNLRYFGEVFVTPTFTVE